MLRASRSRQVARWLGTAAAAGALSVGLMAAPADAAVPTKSVSASSLKSAVVGRTPAAYKTGNVNGLSLIGSATGSRPVMTAAVNGL
jgi:hypothetical protein